MVSGKNWPTINWGPSKTHASSKSSLKWSTMMMRNEGMRMILRAVLIVKENSKMSFCEMAWTGSGKFEDIGDNCVIGVNDCNAEDCACEGGDGDGDEWDRNSCVLSLS